MGKILKFDEIKKNEHIKYSESYEIKFWIKDGEFWKQIVETYFGKSKGEHEYIFERWKKDYKNKNVKFISLHYL